MSQHNSTPEWQRTLQIELAEIVIPDLANIVSEYVPERAYDESGRKGISVFGLRQGPFVSYYDNKQLKSRVVYVNGQLHGVYEGWHENGQEYKCVYVNGQQHGVTEWWYYNGQQRYKCNYVNGQLYGVAEEWYENGQQMYKCNYVNGQLHVAEEWYENGQQSYKRNYVNGQLS